MAQKKIALLTMMLSCGGVIQTYIPCKNEKDLLKNLRKKYSKGWGEFGHFRVADKSVIHADYKIFGVH